MFERFIYKMFQIDMGVSYLIYHTTDDIDIIMIEFFEIFFAMGREIDELFFGEYFGETFFMKI